MGNRMCGQPQADRCLVGRADKAQSHHGRSDQDGTDLGSEKC